MTALALYNPTILRMVTFIITLVHRFVYTQFYRTLNFARSFANNWLEIPLTKQEEQTLPSNSVLKTLSVFHPYQANQSHISFSKAESYSKVENSDVSILKVEDVQEKPERFKRLSLSEKSSQHLRLKVKELVNDKGVEEPRKASQVPKAKMSGEARRRDYMSTAPIKLDAYNRINREYFYSKYQIGVEVDEYSFMHPSAKTVQLSNLLTPSTGRLWKSSKVTMPRKKAITFKPTELSTIFENLAY